MSDATQTTTPNPNTPAAPKPKKFAEIMADAMPKFADVIPQFMRERVKEFVRLAINDIPKNPALAKIAAATPQKIVVALMDCARLGLMPGPLGHVYLVPFGDEVQVVTGYKGLIDLARRSGKVARVETDVIYAEDAFEYKKGDKPIFSHEPSLLSTKRTTADIIAAYAFAYDENGVNLGGAVMPRADVDAIRARSKSGNKGPWVTDYAEMAKKTAIRRASKLWPVSTEFHDALDVDDVHEDKLVGTVSAVSADRLESKAPPLTDGSLYDDEPASESTSEPSSVTVSGPPRE